LRIENLEKLVVKTIEELADFNRFVEYLSFMGHGNIHNFSVENQLAIYGQAPKASLLADFIQWKKTGRYPLANSGISVYPLSTYNLIGKFSDCWFDVSGTKGKKVKPWKITDEQRKNLVNHFQGNALLAYEEYFRDYIQMETEAELLSESSNLYFTEEPEKIKELCDLISECSYKVYMERLDVPYQMSDSAQHSFYVYLAPNGIINAALFSKCMTYVQSKSHMLISVTGTYVITENRRKNKYAESGNRGDNRQRSAFSSGTDGTGTLSKDDRGRIPGHPAAAGTGKDPGITGIRISLILVP